MVRVSSLAVRVAGSQIGHMDLAPSYLLVSKFKLSWKMR